MKNLHRCSVLFSCLAMLWTTGAAFQSPLKAADLPAFTDPAEAGPDFLVQGEYVGKVGGELEIAWQPGGTILMTGPATEAFRGTFEWDDYA